MIETIEKQSINFTENKIHFTLELTRNIFVTHQLQSCDNDLEKNR